MSFYLGDLVSSFSYPVFINVGAPKKRWKQKKTFVDWKFSNYSIVEFSYGLSFLPNRFKVRVMLQRAIKYIISHMSDGDLLLLYHSPSFSKYYKKLISAFGINNVVIHVAELYSDIGNISLTSKKEIQSLEPFSKFIFMSHGLKEKILGDNIDKKYKFIYGVYRTKTASSMKQHDKIHVVYSGTASKIKGGLYNALEASKYLDERFLVHIYCKADETLEKYIRTFNVDFGGYISEGELFNKLLNYDIGLSTQNPLLPFNASSFPSKVVNYLACGLNVVSSKTISIVDSPFNNHVFYYDEENVGQSIADSILQASKNINREKNQSFISSLNEQALIEIAELFEVMQ